MNGINSHLAIALHSITCFTDDGKLDTNELNYLLGLAKADGTIDADERRVLLSILDKVGPDMADAGTHQRIAEIRAELA